MIAIKPNHKICNNMPQETTVYLHPSAIQWVCSADSYTNSADSRIRRSYDTLKYASSLIDGDVNEFKLSDAIMNLKRAVNVRLKLLDELYKFSHVSFLKKFGALERLESVGLARPFLIRQLFELRNDIEHNDAPPPVVNRVRELMDVVWYFLKSTDSAVAIHSRTLMFRVPGGNDDANDPWFAIEAFTGESKRIEVSGWFAAPIISFEEGWEIAIKRFIKYPLSSPRKDLTGDVNVTPDFLNHGRFTGTVEAEGILFTALWEKMFSLSEA